MQISNDNQGNTNLQCIQNILFKLHLMYLPNISLIYLWLLLNEWMKAVFCLTESYSLLVNAANILQVFPERSLERYCILSFFTIQGLFLLLFWTEKKQRGSECILCEFDWSVSMYVWYHSFPSGQKSVSITVWTYSTQTAFKWSHGATTWSAALLSLSIGMNWSETQTSFCVCGRLQFQRRNLCRNATYAEIL